MSTSPGTADLHIFAVRLLHDIGAPVTKANLRYINAWAHREGTSAQNNPLATTQHESGSSSLSGNTSGVQEYPTVTEGAAATATTLRNGNYPDVLAALHGGHPSLSTHFAGLKTWSGGGYDNLAGEPTNASAGNFAENLGIPTKISDVPTFIQHHLILIIAIILLIVILRK